MVNDRSFLPHVVFVNVTGPRTVHIIRGEPARPDDGTKKPRRGPDGGESFNNRCQDKRSWKPAVADGGKHY